MNRLPYLIALTSLALACGGCEHAAATRLPSGADAAALFAPPSEGSGPDEIMRPGDRLAIRVLGEPELTSEQYRIDANGYVQLPLAGEIIAAGRRPSELREDIVMRLGTRFIRDPQVAVIVLERLKTTFAVEGDVKDPGVFEATDSTTLLSAIAEAKSPTEVARLDEVMIFRTVNGQRMGGRFNLLDIRRGNAADPQILAGDTIVVGHSALKGAWREFLQAAPAFSIFYYLRN